jgi:hypothetical protein
MKKIVIAFILFFWLSCFSFIYATTGDTIISWSWGSLENLFKKTNDERNIGCFKIESNKDKGYWFKEIIINEKEIGLKVNWKELKVNKYCSFYDKNWNYVLEMKNIKYVPYTFSSLWDVYVNWNKVLEEVQFQGFHWSELPKYDKKRNIISTHEWRWDVGGAYSYYKEYDLLSKKYKWYNSLFGPYDYIIEPWITNLTAFKKIIFFNSNFLKENNQFYISMTWWSLLSISMTWWLNKNYLYDSRLTGKFDEKELMEDKDTYNFILSWKKMILDFAELKQKQYKMKSIFSSENHFGYNLLLTKDKKSNFSTINFKKLEQPIFWPNFKDVKNIWITSCTVNGSSKYEKEYMLTRAKNWDFKYNISTKFNNKCNIPYKITAYYTDGTKETGEYYVLFDY